MPNTKSAKKRLRQDEERRIHNRAVKSSLKTQLKKVHAAISEGDLAKADEEFKEAAKRLDRAGSRRIIHPNKAARTKSRLQKSIKAAKSAG